MTVRLRGTTATSVSGCSMWFVVILLRSTHVHVNMAENARLSILQLLERLKHSEIWNTRRCCYCSKCPHPTCSKPSRGGYLYCCREKFGKGTEIFKTARYRKAYESYQELMEPFLSFGRKPFHSETGPDVCYECHKIRIR